MIIDVFQLRHFQNVQYQIKYRKQVFSVRSDFLVKKIRISCKLSLITYMTLWLEELLLPPSLSVVFFFFFLLLVSVLSLYCLNDLSSFLLFFCLKNTLSSFPVEQALETHCLRYFETVLNVILFVRILAKCFSMQKNQKHIIWEQILCSRPEMIYWLYRALGNMHLQYIFLQARSSCKYRKSKI